MGAFRGTVPHYTTPEKPEKTEQCGVYLTTAGNATKKLATDPKYVLP